MVKRAGGGNIKDEVMIAVITISFDFEGHHLEKSFKILLRNGMKLKMFLWGEFQ